MLGTAQTEEIIHFALFAYRLQTFIHFTEIFNWKQINYVNYVELTIPGETRLDTAHKLKTESYSHFVRDITTHTVTVTPFEVGAHTGHINNDNKKRLKTLHSFCTKDIKLKKFKENISAISILSSHYIFNCRNQEMWSTPDHILAPFPNQWMYVKIHPDKKPPCVNLQEDLW